MNKVKTVITYDFNIKHRSPSIIIDTRHYYNLTPSSIRRIERMINEGKLYHYGISGMFNANKYFYHSICKKLTDIINTYFKVKQVTTINQSLDLLVHHNVIDTYHKINGIDNKNINYYLLIIGDYVYQVKNYKTSISYLRFNRLSRIHNLNNLL